MGRNTIAQRVKHLRIKRGWNQAELAARISTPEREVPRQSIQTLESGLVKQPRFIKDLAEVLGTTTSYLYEGVLEGAKIESGLDIAKLTQTIECIEKLNTEHNLGLTAPQKTKLIIHVYERLLLSNLEIDENYVLDLVPLVT